MAAKYSGDARTSLHSAVLGSKTLDTRNWKPLQHRYSTIFFCDLIWTSHFFSFDTFVGIWQGFHDTPQKGQAGHGFLYAYSDFGRLAF